MYKMKLYGCLFFVAFTALIFNYSDAARSRKNGATLPLAERVQHLTDLSQKVSIIRLNTQRFRDFVSVSPKNYSVVVMFTALQAKRQCSFCRLAYDEFAIVADSYRLANTQSNRLYFAMVDFDEGADVFQQLGISTAPVFIHFPPKRKATQSDYLDIQRVGFSADAIGKWVAERTDIQIRIFRPPNYSGTVGVLLLSLLVGSFLYVRRNNLDFLQNKTGWAFLALMFCFTMVSGQMWNHIRNPPFSHRTSSGAVAYVHGSSQNQLVLETYIVFILNAAITVGMILVIESATNNGDVKKRRVLAIIGLGLFVIFFAFLLSIFRSKAHGYPYSFLFR